MSEAILFREESYTIQGAIFGFIEKWVAGFLSRFTRNV